MSVFVSSDNMVILLDITYHINDYATWRWFNEKKKHTSKIYTTSSGRNFIICGKRRYYLDEFINLHTNERLRED